MITDITSKRKNLPYRIFSCFIAVSFVFNVVLPPGYAQLIPQTLLNLPAPGTMVSPTAGFAPILVKGITVHPENPLQFDFIVDPGDSRLQGEELRSESTRLIKYFLASLTVPEDELWVNLSPYEQDRIISDTLSQTEMGRDMLAQDYVLKQLTASSMYPEKELGRKFWDRVYKKAREQFGTAEIPVNTFNKVWIVPEKAVVYQHANSAFVVEARLKVLLDSDYAAQKLDPRSSILDTRGPSSIEHQASSIETSIIKEIILPAIEKEVNTGETFARLRQVYNSMILAAWYKQNLKESLLGQVYVNRARIKGVDVEDKEISQKIYSQYLEAFKKGVYNYIREDEDPATHDVIPRKYFSGGEKFGDFLKQPENIETIKEDGTRLSLLQRGQLPGPRAFIAPTRMLEATDHNAKIVGEAEQAAAGQAETSEEGEGTSSPVGGDIEIKRINTQVVQSNDFISDLNDRLVNDFGKEELKKFDYDKARALAYEVDRRLSDREGARQFRRWKRAEYALGETDPDFDRYNRVLEGVIQILHKDDYGAGNVIINAWGYTPEWRDANLRQAGEAFAKLFFSGIVKEINRLIAHEGHTINAPPSTQEILRRIGALTPQAIDQTSAKDLADQYVRPLIQAPEGLSLFPQMQKKFFLYSAGPGTGKEAVWKEFNKNYGDLIDKLILYHTRNPRVEEKKDTKEKISEKDGKIYNFRSEAELTALAERYPVMLARVNRQLQGLAKRRFNEPISFPVAETAPDKMRMILDGNDGRPKDLNVREEKGMVSLDRPIHGLEDVFREGKKAVIMEGGFGWYISIKKEYPDINVAFIAPFSDEVMDVRAQNHAWIVETFRTPESIRLAYEKMFNFIEDNKAEINIDEREDVQKSIVAYVRAAETSGGQPEGSQVSSSVIAPLPVETLRDSQSVAEAIAWKTRKNEKQEYENEYIFGGGFGYDIRINNAEAEWESVAKLMYTIGRTLGGGKYLNHRGTALVMGDQRSTSDAFRLALAQGLSDEGIGVATQNAGDAITTGLTSRKGLADNFDLVIQITGSHNPKQSNGVKISSYKGLPFFGRALVELSAAVETQQGWSPEIRQEGIVAAADFINEHIEALNKVLPDLRNPPSLVADFRRGAAGKVFMGVAAKKGYEVIRLDSPEAALPNEVFRMEGKPVLIVLNDAPSAGMEAGIWDPSKPEAFDGIRRLQERIYNDGRFSGRRFAGAVFDGDGDRAGLMTEEGRLVMPERMLMAYYQRMILANEEGIRVLNELGHTVKLALDVRASRVIIDVLKNIALRKSLKIEGEFIAAGFPNHRTFVMEELEKIQQLLDSHPSLAAEKIAAVKKLMLEYTSAEASGHFFFNVLSPEKFLQKKSVVDDGITSSFLFLHLAGTMNDYEFKDSPPSKKLSPGELTVGKADELFEVLPVTNEIRLSDAPSDVAKKQALAEEIMRGFARQHPELIPMPLEQFYQKIENARNNPPQRQSWADPLLIVDGIRVELTNGVWVLLRKSNTSAVIVFKAEANSGEKKVELERTMRFLDEAMREAVASNPDFAGLKLKDYEKELARVAASSPLENIPDAVTALAGRDLKGVRVLIRADLNVPMTNSGEILDETRLKEVEPIIEFLLKKQADIILLGHNGRLEDGKDSRKSLRRLLEYFQLRFHKVHVTFYEKSITAEGLQLKPENLIIHKEDNEGSVHILQNVRFAGNFENGEKGSAGREAFGRGLAGLTKGDNGKMGILVVEAFGDIGSKGASIEDLHRHFTDMGGEVYPGPAMAKEFKTSDELLPPVDDEDIVPEVPSAEITDFLKPGVGVADALQKYWQAGGRGPVSLLEIVVQAGLDKEFVLAAINGINGNFNSSFSVKPVGLNKKLDNETLWIQLVPRLPLGESRPSPQGLQAFASSPVLRDIGLAVMAGDNFFVPFSEDGKKPSHIAAVGPAVRFILAARGYEIVESTGKKLDAGFATAIAFDPNFRMPVDVWVRDPKNPSAKSIVVNLDGKQVIPAGSQVLDVGPRTARMYASFIPREKGQVAWVGPMDIDGSAGEGTKEIIRALPKDKDRTVVLDGNGKVIASSPAGNRRQSSDVSRQLTTDDGRLMTNPGGIDLNPALLDLQIKRDGNFVPLPLPQQPIGEMHIDGFIPVIINITPVTDLPLLLGLADTKQNTEETIPASKAREPEEISVLN